jgi:tetratricopeptide (TPR) repeat protein
MSADQKAQTAVMRIDVFLWERKYREALQEVESLPDGLLTSYPGALCGKYYLAGVAQKALQDESGAREAFLKARSIAEARLKQSPDDADMHVYLARVLAWLGEKDAALAESRRATELIPESKDAFKGPEIMLGVAEVHAILGDHASAIEMLKGLLSRPSTLTVQVLKVHPIWDPLRSDPAFQKLCEEKQR